MSQLERVPLSFLFAQNANEQPPVEPIVPFPAFFGEGPVIVTAILERTAVVASTTDRYDRQTLTFNRVLVDPSMVEWKTSIGGRTSENGHVHTRWNREVAKEPLTDVARQAIRDAGDRKALANQEELAREAAARAAARRPQPIQREKEEPMGIDDTPRTCKHCGKTKPREEFDRAGIYGAYCHDCKPIVKAERAAAGEKKLAVVGTTSATAATVTQTHEPHVLPIKRSVKAKAARRGKKRKYTRRATVETPANVKASGHRNGRPSLTLKELVAGAKRLKSEHAIALKTIDTLQAEKAELYAQLQEILG